MTGLSTRFIEEVAQLVLPGLEDFVKYQYGDMWQNEFAVLDQWRKDHGLTVIFDSKNGLASFCPGIEWAPLIHSDYIVVIFP